MIVRARRGGMHQGAAICNRRTKQTAVTNRRSLMLNRSSKDWRASTFAAAGVSCEVELRGFWRLPASAAMIWGAGRESVCDRAAPASRSTRPALFPRSIFFRGPGRSLLARLLKIRSPPPRCAQPIANSRFQLTPSMRCPHQENPYNSIGKDPTTNRPASERLVSDR